MCPRTNTLKKKINIELPQDLVGKIDRSSRKKDVSRSETIRKMLAEKIAEEERKEFLEAMKQGYLANREFSQASSDEWDFTLKDGL